MAEPFRQTKTEGRPRGAGDVAEAQCLTLRSNGAPKLQIAERANLWTPRSCPKASRSEASKISNQQEIHLVNHISPPPLPSLPPGIAGQPPHRCNEPLPVRLHAAHKSQKCIAPFRSKAVVPPNSAKSPRWHTRRFLIFPHRLPHLLLRTILPLAHSAPTAPIFPLFHEAARLPCLRAFALALASS